MNAEIEQNKKFLQVLKAQEVEKARLKEKLSPSLLIQSDDELAEVAGDGLIDTKRNGNRHEYGAVIDPQLILKAANMDPQMQE